MTDLRDAYRNLADRVPAMGDAEEALYTAARRRRQQRIVVPLVVAVAATGVTLAVAQTPWDSAGRSPQVGNSPSPTSSSTVRQAPTWPPEPLRRGGVPIARIGTLIYGVCGPDAGCDVTLVRPNGSEVDLATVWPSMATRLRAQGLAGVTLSYDAQWLGVPTAHGYTVYAFGASNGISVRTDTPDSRWAPVGWTLGSFGLALVETRGGAVTHYAEIEPSRASIHWKVAAPEPFLFPVADGGDSIQVAQPLVHLGSVELPRVTRLDVLNVVGRSAQYRPGSVHRFREEPLDLSPCMRPDETLVGPFDVPVLFTPPAGAMLWRFDESNAVIAFRGNSVELTPSAVIRMTCDYDPERARYALPQSTDQATWTLLSPVTTGDSIMTRTQSGSSMSDIVRVGLDRSPTTLYQVPADAVVLAPGERIDR